MAPKKKHAAIDITQAIDTGERLLNISISYISNFIALFRPPYFDNPTEKLTAGDLATPLAAIYQECLFLSENDNDPVLIFILDILTKLDIPFTRFISFAGINEITPHVLQHQIAPYLAALEQVQKTHYQIRSQQPPPVRIVSLHNELPKIEIHGLEKVVDAVARWLSPRQRKIEEFKAQMAMQESYVQSQQDQFDLTERGIALDGLKRNQSIDNFDPVVQAEVQARIDKTNEDAREKRLTNDLLQIQIKEGYQRLTMQESRFISELALSMMTSLLGDTLTAKESETYLPIYIAVATSLYKSQLTLLLGHQEQYLLPR